jgi:flagellar hook-length control protein FliK
MTAHPISTVPAGIKAPPAQTQGGHGVASFINYLDAAGTANLNTSNSLHGSTALTTSLPVHKLTTKSKSGDDTGANTASNQSNAQANATVAPLSVPANTANDSKGAKDPGTGAGATTLAANTIANGAANGGRTVVVAAPVGNGKTVALGTGTPTTPNQFAGLISAGSTVSVMTTQAGVSTDPANSSTTNIASSQSALAATQLPPVQADATGEPNSATPTVSPPGNANPQSSSAPKTTFVVNQFGAPGATSATDPAASAAATAAAAASDAKSHAQADPAQTDGSSANSNATATANLPGAAALNARIVAGATNLSVHPNQAATQAAATLAQPSDLDTSAAPAKADTPVLSDKAHDAAGIVSGSSGNAAPAATPTTSANAATDPRNFSAALDHAAGQGHDSTSDTTDDPSKSGMPLGTDAAGTPSPSASLLGAQNGTATNPTNTLPTDASLRPTLIALPASEQVAANLTQALKTGANEIQIQLKPASLGVIDVKLNVNHDGRLTAVISADRSDTLNLLKQDVGNLQQSLRDAGFNADSGSLSFNLRGDTQSFAQNATPQTAATGSASMFSDLPITSTPPRTLRQHLGAVDIQV